MEDRVVLIACAGMMDSSDLPRTAKFMSSPLVQTLTGSSLVRVSVTFVACRRLKLITHVQSYLQHLISSKGNTSLMVSAHVATEADNPEQQPLTGEGETEATDSVKVFTTKEAGDGRIQEVGIASSTTTPFADYLLRSSVSNPHISQDTMPRWLRPFVMAQYEV